MGRAQYEPVEHLARRLQILGKDRLACQLRRIVDARDRLPDLVVRVRRHGPLVLSVVLQFGRQLNRLYDACVPRAAAEIARDRFADGRLVRIGFAIE